MVKGAAPRNRHVSVHMPCTLNALSDGLEDSASEDVAICPKVCWQWTGGGDAGGIEEKR